MSQSKVFPLSMLFCTIMKLYIKCATTVYLSWVSLHTHSWCQLPGKAQHDLHSSSWYKYYFLCIATLFVNYAQCKEVPIYYAKNYAHIISAGRAGAMGSYVPRANSG